tara:strand:- start:522 stop:1016 length:495 start_codon:yes stop_codon:yes gene_type:complete
LKQNVKSIIFETIHDAAEANDDLRRKHLQFAVELVQPPALAGHSPLHLRFKPGVVMSEDRAVPGLRRLLRHHEQQQDMVGTVTVSASSPLRGVSNALFEHTSMRARRLALSSLSRRRSGASDCHRHKNAISWTRYANGQAGSSSKDFARYTPSFTNQTLGFETE